MVKTSPLSSDIDVIKEFEELKLKQKLLIESLKRNSDTQQNKLFLEINSKLDFLVKIFTESSNSDSQEEKADFNAKFDEILEKINSFSQNVDERFSKLDETILSIQTKEKESVKTEILEANAQDSKYNQELDLQQEPKSDLPPPPEFETKIDEVQKSEETEKKKKKWF